MAEANEKRYHRKLLIFLSVATFFEGYDFIAITQIMGEMFVDFGIQQTNWMSPLSAAIHSGISEANSQAIASGLIPTRPELDANALAWAGHLGAMINAGAIFAYFLIRKADIWGRKTVLNITIIGYITTTFLTAFSPNVWVFVALQFVGRIFLLAEWSTAMVIAAEEFPARKRATVIGILQGCSTLGAIVCVGLVPLLLQSPWGWRSVYVVGILPLIIIAWSRRNLRETSRFESHAGTKTAAQRRRSLFSIWKSPYAARLVLLSLIWFLAYIPAQTSIHFWKLFAQGERGLTDGQVGLAIAIAAVVSMPLVFLSGKLIDILGRKVGSILVFSVSAFGVFGCYTFHQYGLLVFALTFGIFGSAAFLPILNTYTAELFPTKFRGDAFAWSNNLIGRWGYVFAPELVGLIAVGVGGYGPVIQWLPIFSILSMIMILTTLPETKGQELEATAELQTS